MLMHGGALEQRWAETAWLCHVIANSQRTSAESPVYEPKQFNPLRLAEVAAATEGGNQSTSRRGGGLPLDVETVRAYHAALKAKESQACRQRRVST